MSTPIVEYEDVVRQAWIDSNGHMNLAYYVVFSTSPQIARALGIGVCREATGNSCFT